MPRGATKPRAEKPLATTTERVAIRSDVRLDANDAIRVCFQAIRPYADAELRAVPPRGIREAKGGAHRISVPRFRFPGSRANAEQRQTRLYFSYFVRRQYMGVDAKIAVHGDVCRYRVDIVRS